MWNLWENTGCQGSARVATSRLGQRQRVCPGQLRGSASLGQLAAREEAGRLKGPCFPQAGGLAEHAPPHLLLDDPVSLFSKLVDDTGSAADHLRKLAREAHEARATGAM